MNGNRAVSKRTLILQLAILASLALLMMGAAFDCIITGVDENGRPIIAEGQEFTAVVTDANSTPVIKVHWVQEGAHASDPVTEIPPILDGLADAWNYMHVSGEPGIWASQTSDCGLGGDDLLDVYVWEINGPLNGRTSADSTCSSYHIHIRAQPAALIFATNQAERDLVRKMTASHELNHVAQHSFYPGMIEAPWGEGTATWVPQQLYDIFHALPLMGNIMIDGFLAVPRFTIYGDEFDAGNPYAAYAPFFHYFLTEYFDDDTILAEIASLLGTYDYMSGIYRAVRDTVASRGETHSNAIQNFREWTYMTCANDDGLHYQWNLGACASSSVNILHAYSAGAYPSSPVSVPDTEAPMSSGANYITFVTDGADAYVLEMAADNYGEEWGVSVIRKYAGSNTYDLARLETERYKFPADGAPRSFLIDNWSDYEKIILVVQNLAPYAWPAAPYTYSLTPPAD